MTIDTIHISQTQGIYERKYFFSTVSHNHKEIFVFHHCNFFIIVRTKFRIERQAGNLLMILNIFFRFVLVWILFFSFWFFVFILDV